MRNTQGQKVMNYIKEHGGITTFEAFIELGITRLAAVIWELKNRHGVDNIKTRAKKVKTTSGKEVTVAYYYFGEEDKNGI